MFVVPVVAGPQIVEKAKQQHASDKKGILQKTVENGVPVLECFESSILVVLLRNVIRVPGRYVRSGVVAPMLLRNLCCKSAPRKRAKTDTKCRRRERS